MHKRSGRVLPLVLLSIAGLAILAGGGWAVLSLMKPASPGAVPAATSLGVAADGGEIRSLTSALDAARQYMDSNESGKAEAILARAVERFPGEQRAVLLHGECLLLLGRKDEAYEAYDRAIFIGPDNPEYRHAAATIAAEIGRLSDAEAHYGVARSMAPANPKFPLYLAQVQRALGKVDEARANLVITTKLDPSISIAWASLAAIALDENRPSVALGYIEKARQLEPERNEWRIIEARALRREGEVKRALDLLLAIPVSERLHDAALLQEIALCYGLMERPGDAAAMYVEAVSGSEGDAELAYQAALWLERAGEGERALMYGRQAQALGHKEAKALVERLAQQIP